MVEVSWEAGRDKEDNNNTTVNQRQLTLSSVGVTGYKRKSEDIESSGAARGCGWQKIRAFSSLGPYYLVGIPCAILLTFVLHLGGRFPFLLTRYDMCIGCARGFRLRRLLIESMIPPSQLPASPVTSGRFATGRIGKLVGTGAVSCACKNPLHEVALDKNSLHLMISKRLLELIVINIGKDRKIGGFLMPSSSTIPLHNHPEMTVLSKLLYGSVHVKAYDWVVPCCSRMFDGSSVRLAKVVIDKILTAPCDISVLYPSTGGNIHSLTALTPSAVLDIFGPPYNHRAGRSCTYYQAHPHSSLRKYILCAMHM